MNRRDTLQPISARFFSEHSIDEFCCELLDDLFPRSGGTIWKASTILQFKDIFEAQTYTVSVYGLYHPSTLSTPILVRIIKDLVCNDFFEHHTARTHFDLELHFRCIIAGLRLLPMHGIQAGSGTLAYNYFDQLYNRMTWWQNFYNGQTVGVQGEQLKTKNYNNEFLIVYARDLIASSPADRTVASNVATRLIAGASFLGHAYAKNVVLAAQSLKTAVQVKHPPSPWNVKYRTMDDLCVSIRVFRQYKMDGSGSGEEDILSQDIDELWESAEENVVIGLSDILMEELKQGIGSDRVGTAYRGLSDAIGTAPIERRGHFVFGILDLIQHVITSIDSVKINNKVVELALQIAISPHSFLRCKAFEVLATMSSKRHFGHINTAVDEILEGDGWTPEEKEKAESQWYTMRRRVMDTEHLTKELRKKSGQPVPLTAANLRNNHEEISSAPTGHSVEKILDLLKSLDETLVCPFGTEDEPIKDLSPFIPCGHFASLSAWRRYLGVNPGKKNCPYCDTPVERMGNPMDMSKVGKLVKGLREECGWLEKLLEWNKNVDTASMTSQELASHEHENNHRHQANGPITVDTTDTPLINLMDDSPVECVPQSSNEQNFTPNASQRPNAVKRKPINSRTSYTTVRSETDSAYFSEGSLSPGLSTVLQSAEGDPFSSAQIPDKGKSVAPNLGIPSERFPSQESLGMHAERQRVRPASEPPKPQPTRDRQIQENPHLRDTPVTSTSVELVESPVAIRGYFSGPQLGFGTSPMKHVEKALPHTPSPRGTPIVHQQHRKPPRSGSSTPDATYERRNTITTIATSHPPSVHHESCAASVISSQTSMTATSSYYQSGFRIIPSHHKIGSKSNYDAAAVSASCQTMALLDRNNFVIYSLAKTGSPKLVCAGNNSGKCGLNPKQLTKTHNAYTSRNFKPSYQRAVISDELLCIAGIPSCVDIHNVTSGQQVGAITLPNKLRSSSMALSPDGLVLAVGTETGEILVYQIGHGNFDTVPQIFDASPKKPIVCMTMSPNSEYLAICTHGNVINVFHLASGYCTTFDRELKPRDCEIPNCGVTSIALYLTASVYADYSTHDSTSLFIVADAIHGYPVIVRNIIVQSDKYDVIHLDDKKFERTIRCGAFCPVNDWSVALIVNRSGQLKLVSPGATGWSVELINKQPKVDVQEMRWRVCSLVFSRDGHRAVALDLTGKLLVTDFSESGPRVGTI